MATDSEDSSWFVGGGRARTSKAYELIRDKLISGTYQPGDKLDVMGLAKTLGTSRQPIMAAMQQLSNEDLVQIIPQVGCVAAVFSAEEWLDFRRFFASGEALITQIATERGTPEQIRALRPLSNAITELLSPDIPLADKAREYRKANQRFHGHIHKMARSPIIDRQLKAMWNRTDYYISTLGHAHAFTDRVPIAINEHEAICNAIERRDAITARRLMELHILEQFEGGAH
jgi:DNA-binding GntR family transcriptional regulator